MVNNSCVEGQRIRFTQIPPLSNTNSSFTFPLDPEEIINLNNLAKTENRSDRFGFEKLNTTTMSIFIHFKSFLEGPCIENTLIQFHSSLKLCYNEDTDRFLVTDSSNVVLAQSSSFYWNQPDRWIFFAITIKLYEGQSGISFFINNEKKS